MARPGWAPFPCAEGSRIPRVGLQDDGPILELEDQAPSPAGLSARSGLGADLIDRVPARLVVGHESLQVADRITAGQHLTPRIDEAIDDRHRSSLRVRL